MSLAQKTKPKRFDFNKMCSKAYCAGARGGKLRQRIGRAENYVTANPEEELRGLSFLRRNLEY